MRKDHLEIECKLELDKETYEKIKKNFSTVLSEPMLQQNIFFDTKEKSLLDSHWVLRLRIENGRCFLTLKGKGSITESIHARPEYEDEITPELAHDLKSGFNLPECDLLPCTTLHNALGDIHLFPYISFENIRIRIPWESYALELDRFEINGTLFYELEAEADSIRITELEKKLINLFKEKSWYYKPSSASKFKRALIANGIKTL